MTNRISPVSIARALPAHLDADLPRSVPAIVTDFDFVDAPLDAFTTPLPTGDVHEGVGHDDCRLGPCVNTEVRRSSRKAYL